MNTFIKEEKMTFIFLILSIIFTIICEIIIDDDSLLINHAYFGTYSLLLLAYFFSKRKMFIVLSVLSFLWKTYLIIPLTIRSPIAYITIFLVLVINILFLFISCVFKKRKMFLTCFTLIMITKLISSGFSWSNAIDWDSILKNIPLFFITFWLLNIFYYAAVINIKSIKEKEN